LCLIKRRFVDGANQANQNFIIPNRARATNASLTAFECRHLVHIADVKHGRYRSHGYETTLSLDHHIL
jgi:hypothetical protein